MAPLKYCIKYAGVIAVVLVLYCMWLVANLSVQVQDVNSRVNELHRALHILHGAELMKSGEKQVQSREDDRPVRTVRSRSLEREMPQFVPTPPTTTKAPSLSQFLENTEFKPLSPKEVLVQHHMRNNITLIEMPSVLNVSAARSSGTQIDLSALNLDWSDPASYLPQLGGENVISMSVWGKDQRYTNGILRNADLIQEFFPGWKLRVYSPMPSDKARVPQMPSDIIQQLRDLKVDIQFVDSAETAVPPMMWRFLIADDLSVDRFLVRDADSRLSGRDAAAVFAWEQSGLALQCCRDHPSHSAYALSGGLWGGKPELLKKVVRRSWTDLMYGYRNEYLQDMAFLNDVIWPKFKDGHIYCSDSFSCDKWPGSHPFPVRRLGYEHVGQVYGPNEMFRPDDVGILRKSGESAACTPT